MASTHDDRPWWQRWPAELTEIVSGVRAQGWTVASVSKHSELHLVVIRVTGLDDPPGWLEVQLGPGTPSVAPTVVGPPGLPEHQHLTGFNLCLPLTATDTVAAVRSAVELYRDPGSHRAAAAEPRSRYLGRPSDHAVLLPLGLPKGGWGTFTVRARAGPTDLWGWVDCITVGADSAPVAVVRADLTLRESLRTTAPNLPVRRGIWVRTTKADYPLDAKALAGFWRAAATPEALAAAETLIGGTGEDRELSLLPTSPAVRLSGLVVPEEGPKRGVWHERLLLIADRGGVVSTVVTQPLTVSTTRLPDLEPLAEKTVAVAGLGMIGGTVAMHLAQSGLGALRLLDHDEVEAGNLVRQPYDVGDVGMRKITALRRRVLRSAPWCGVDPRYLLYERVEQLRPEQLREWLEGCDLLVAATADSQAEVYLSRFARDAGVPIIGGRVGYGIWGGFVFATQWGLSGCPNCIDQQHQSVVDIPQPDDAGNIYVAGCGHPTFPGSVVDGSTVGDAVARLGLGLLCAAYPSPPGDIGTITLRNGDSAGALAVEWKRFPPFPACTVCP